MAALAIVLILAIAPLPDPTGSDKLRHILAFAMLAGLGWFAFSRLSILQLALGMSALGALVELLQAIPFIEADAQFDDWMADNLGIALMLAVLWGAQQIIKTLWPRAR